MLRLLYFKAQGGKDLETDLDGFQKSWHHCAVWMKVILALEGLRMCFFVISSVNNSLLIFKLV